MSPTNKLFQYLPALSTFREVSAVSIVRAVIHGIVLKLSDLIPVSSSGHLPLIHHLPACEFNHSLAFIFDILTKWRKPCA